ncbi:TRAP transporter substrate-binding protein [Desulfoluna butyratoxydans]|uniref:Trap transporter solute receptor dctp/teaa n=1 Tax=Desulfoluna butyratoxydans TaxID=231438 RepID=A0A4U8YHB5_9BACT|nr:TRAP transporter substrate-binding protein [Desulfoluna butyratoxydans]VFQ42935.1 trap transporter solute receptor dctp/teaa [Desulfoluna butyratoxydans]
MLRKSFAVALSFLTLAVFGLSGAQAAQTIKLGYGDPPESDQGVYARRFKAVVEGLSDGEIKVELFSGGALGTETEMLQTTRKGTLDMSLVFSGNAVPFVKELGTLTMPYLIKNEYDAVKATTGELGAYWNETCVKKGGFRILGWVYSNFRHLTNNKRPVTSLKDVKGLKIRIPQNKIHMATYRAWGANPVPISWPETFTALQQGVVDGQDNPYIVMHTSKFQEVQKYCTEVHHMYALQFLSVGERSWKKYDQKTRDILTRAGIEAQQYNLLFQVSEASKAKEAMAAAGVQMDNLTDEEEWIRLAKEKVWPEFYDFIGGKALIDRVEATLEAK